MDWMKRLLIVLFILSAAAACGGGGGSGTPGKSVLPGANQRTTAKITVAVPSGSGSSARTRPDFIASGTQSVAFIMYQVNGSVPNPQPTPQIEQISPTAPGCSTVSTGTQCTFSVSLYEVPSIVVEILSYASTDGSGTPLAQGFLGPINTTVPITSPLGIALGGIPDRLIASPSALSANADGSTHTLTFTVTAEDANGNTIIQPGNYPSPGIVVSPSADPNGALSFAPNPIVSPALNGTNTVTVTYNSAKAIGVTSLNLTSGFASSSVAFSPLGTGTGSLTAGYSVTEYPIPTTSSGPYGIAAGPGDGAVWFTEQNANQVAKLFPSTCNGTNNCQIREGQLPSPAILAGAIAAGIDGNVWIGGTSPSNAVTSHIDILTPGACSAQTVNNLNGCTQYQEPDPLVSPIVNTIAAGNDSLMHATEPSLSGPYIESYWPVSQPATTYSAYDYNSGAAPFGLSSNNWFTDPGSDSVGSISCYEGCNTSMYSFVSGGSPQGIVNLPNGNLVVADSANNAIVSFAASSCTSTCNFVSTTVPTANAGVKFLTLGRDGNVWFTEYNGNKIGIFYTTPHSPQIVELTLPTTGAGPEGIALGPDGNIYFTEFLAGKIGVVAP
jgi:streptogramin lyase